MIHNGHIQLMLGEKYDPSVDYVVAEKGPALVSKLSQGYRNHGKLPDELSAGNTELFIISPPLPVQPEKVLRPHQPRFKRAPADPEPPPKVKPPPPPLRTKASRPRKFGGKR